MLVGTIFKVGDVVDILMMRDNEPYYCGITGTIEQIINNRGVIVVDDNGKIHPTDIFSIRFKGSTKIY